MTVTSTLQTIFKTAQRETAQEIALLQEQIARLSEQIEYKKTIEAKRDEEMFKSSVRLFMKNFLGKTKEEQTEILDSFQKELSVEPSLTPSQAKPVAKRGRPKKKSSEVPEDPASSKKEVVETTSLPDENVLAPSETQGGGGQPVPLTPDLCEGDSITDVGQCFVTKKPEFNDEEYRNCVLPVIEEMIDYDSESSSIQIGEHKYVDMPLNQLEAQALVRLVAFGSYGIKQMARDAFFPYGDVKEDDPRVRHDLWVIAIESLRKKLLKATNGAIQLEYYIYQEDVYSYDNYVPYEAVSVRLRKAGPLEASQEKGYMSLYESKKKSNSGSELVHDVS